MQAPFSIRLIHETPADAKAALDIYAPYILDTAITFDYEVPSVAEFSEKIAHILPEFPWLVCLEGDKIVGYVYASKHRQKTAYQWSAESSVYLSASYHRKGIAKILYEALFEILALQGYVNVYAGVTLPNEKSERFHLALGFDIIGDFRKIGYKLGAWRDVRWYQLHVAPHADNLPVPKLMKEVENTPLFQEILQKANEKIAQA